MNHFSRTLLLLALVAAGCRQPAEVELVSDESLTNLEAYPVVLPDSDFVATSVDSTGVLPDDQIRYKGSFVVAAVTWDRGTDSKTVAYSRVFIADSAVRVLDRLVGYQGSDVGTVTLNGSLMLKIPHRISLSGIFSRDTVTVRGVRYLTDLTGSYQPDYVYTWVITNRLVPVLSVDMESPEALTVLTPRGGTLHSRARDLPVRWTGGKGKMSIIVSAHDPGRKRTIPLLDLRVRTNNGRAVIPAKLLMQLPPGTTFILTFVLGNKKESQILLPVPGMIMAQAAYVYNSSVELR